MQNPEEQARFYRQLREERSPNDRHQWVLLIKELRVTHGCSIYDAQRLALLKPIWRRWVERQINHDLRCARMARRHIRCNGDAALLVDRDAKLTIR